MRKGLLTKEVIDRRLRLKIREHTNEYHNFRKREGQNGIKNK
jgi:hypothetical protein